MNNTFTLFKARVFSWAQAASYAALAALVAFACPWSAQAQQDAFPTQTLKLLVGFAPGGGADIVARLIAPKLAEQFKQNVVVENRPGAGGNIATDQLIKSAPDGHTLMLGTIGSLAVNQHLSRLAYNPITDTAAVSMAVVFSNVLVVQASSDIKTLDDYIQQARSPDTRLSFGSSGIGSAGHLSGELLKSAANLNNQHIAYRGGAPAMNDLLGGALPSIFSSPSDAIQHIQSGRLRALATTGLKRSDTLPQVPTISESGFAGFEAINWYAFAVPARTPSEVVRKLNAAIAATLNDPQVVAQIRKIGMEPAPTSPAEAARYFKAESDKWGEVIRKAKIKTD
jgi:tripartite-type tricarboxylate transporter receptor subunit TctC